MHPPPVNPFNWKDQLSPNPPDKPALTSHVEPLACEKKSAAKLLLKRPRSVRGIFLRRRGGVCSTAEFIRGIWSWSP